jgi:Replication initiator protein, pSAM2
VIDTAHFAESIIQRRGQPDAAVAADPTARARGLPLSLPSPCPSARRGIRICWARVVHGYPAWTIGWGDPDKAVDVRPVHAAADHPITREAVAAYLAKYATKSTEATGHLSARITAETIDTYADDSHAGRLIDAAWTLGRDPTYRGLRRWAHTLGYGGHFTKSRRYTGTFTAERQRRIAWRRARAATSRLERAGVVDLVDIHDQRTTDVLTELVYVGIGWHTTADAVLANTAAAMARERRQHARDAAHTA